MNLHEQPQKDSPLRLINNNANYSEIHAKTETKEKNAFHENKSAPRAVVKNLPTETNNPIPVEMAPKSANPIPTRIYDKNAKAFYKLGKLLGEGGFAQCYEVTAEATGQNYAVKIVPKDSLVKPKHKHKLLQEIKIHQTLRHENIVRLFRVFEDDHFVYIVMELCENHTMMEYLKMKGRFEDHEAIPILLQLLNAVDYLHRSHVIHRDLKLGNLFLKAGNQLKLGDFGLATLVYGEGDRKRTICGTPNYIAPEILVGGEKGHSYEVDIWSFGVIMYTLLIGRPPFQRQQVKEIYQKIKEASFEFPDNVPISAEGKSLITRMLDPNPDSRPKIEEIRRDPYFTQTFTEKPPLPAVNHLETKKPACSQSQTESGLIKSIQTQLKLVLGNAGRSFRTSLGKETGILQSIKKPNFVYLLKWMDFSTKYGIGYLLSNNSSGFYFNDGTSLILTDSRKSGYYFKPDLANRRLLVRESFIADKPKDEIRNKLQIMEKFDEFLQPPTLSMKRLSLDQQQIENTSEGLNEKNLIFVVKYFRTSQATFFRLSNRILQVNFFDHYKVLISDEGLTFTVIDQQKNSSTFSAASVTNTNLNSLPPILITKLQYISDLFGSMMS